MNDPVLHAQKRRETLSALMDGQAQRLSGVINVSRVPHPIDLAAHLQGADDRVLSDVGSMELARELAIPLFDPITDLRLRRQILAHLTVRNAPQHEGSRACSRSGAERIRTCFVRPRNADVHILARQESERVRIGARALLGANAGVGISIGDDSVVEAGLYVTAGTKVTVIDDSGERSVKAVELSGVSNLLFRRNSVSGRVEATPRSGVGITLNSALHK